MTDLETTDILERFRKVVLDGSMVKCPTSRSAELAALVASRARIVGAENIEKYLHIVSNDALEFETFVGNLTTKETYFFRIPGHFEALRKSIFPLLEDRLGNEMCRKGALGDPKRKTPVRIWSAGCATGEEPYSIAMALHEGIKYKRAWDVEILATDISREAIGRALDGVYENRSPDDLPGIYEKYVSRTAEGFSVIRDVKNLIKFKVFNLNNLVVDQNPALFMSEPDGGRTPFYPDEAFDMIFFRNVLIYFEIESQERLIKKLYRCLKPGGYFFTGDVEQLHIYDHGFETVEMENAVIYRKPEERRG